MTKLATVVERMTIQHPAFANARKQIEQSFSYALDQGEAECLAIIGESGTGKTSVLEAVRVEHPSMRCTDGMSVPILSATVPSGPTVKSLAGVLLAAIGDPEPDKGTSNELTRRLKAHMKTAETRMIMIDEFQHFYDRGKQKIMYEVADWLKVLIEQTKTTLVVAGLPSCTGVIDQNEQLARRFDARVQLPRFSWAEIEQREQFMKILFAFEKEISKQYQTPELSTEAMAFRFYCATGGLIGYLSKLLRQVLRNANSAEKTTVLLEDIATAHAEAIWSNERISKLPEPFTRSFKLTDTIELLDAVTRIGTIPVEPHAGFHPACRNHRHISNSR